MAYSAEIVADSVSARGDRLTTALLKYPRMVHAEHLRHRSFSYSVASSRALPIKAMIEQVMIDPVIPVYWGKNRSGMQATDELTDRQKRKAEKLWLEARDQAVVSARMLENLAINDPNASEEDNNVGVHKQVTNRLLEPWMWVTVLVTGTDWENFFWLRCHPAAQPEIRHVAIMMEELYRTFTPQRLLYSMWHLPFIKEEDWTDAEEMAYDQAGIELGAPLRSPSDRFALLKSAQDILKYVSAGRCARTSYLTHLGHRDISEDLRLAQSLIQGAAEDPPQPMHLSPYEHQARPLDDEEYVNTEDAKRIIDFFPRLVGLMDPQLALNARGNLHGWISQRSEITDESGRDALTRWRRTPTTEES